MSEFKLKSPPSQRVHLYVNPYTHDYEITNIPTKYQVQHIGYYVGSFFLPSFSRKKMFITTSDIKLWIKQRWINDMERTEKEQIFVLRVTKQDTGLEIGPDKEKQTDTSVFVYVDPYSHELKILPTVRLAHQFQNMKFVVGVLKSFCNEYKINSPQNTISVESQTENTEKYSMQNDSENTECRLTTRLSTIKTSVKQQNKWRDIYQKV